jgi:glycosyltransferase involved in cell wall biosynthesis
VPEIEAALPHLSLADQVALPDVDSLFRFSDLLVNTSVVEGFPNTFVQAGMHGIPIVSMSVDPDAMLSAAGCGRLADGTPAGLVRTIEALLTDREAYAAASAACVRWVAERHDADGRAAELRAVIHGAAITHARRGALRVR